MIEYSCDLCSTPVSGESSLQSLDIGRITTKISAAVDSGVAHVCRGCYEDMMVYDHGGERRIRETKELCGDEPIIDLCGEEIEDDYDF
jgi:hypothetical protein